MKTKIGRFSLYDNKPNTLAGPYYYESVFHFNTNNEFKDRYVRVYLPSDYFLNNNKKRYPVLYMFDGQNLCDESLSGYGEWNVDECIESRVKSKRNTCIIVGINCPFNEVDRINEMMPKEDLSHLGKDIEVTGNGYIELLGDFIINEVKPCIDKTFKTLKDKRHTGIGGSSMGGLASFIFGMKYKDVFGYSLVFSPAFLIYKSRYFIRQLKEFNFSHKDYGKFFIYVGGQKFEKTFVSLTLKTYDILSSKGFKDQQLRLVFDSHNIHHESSWSQYFDLALSFFLDE